MSTRQPSAKALVLDDVLAVINQAHRSLKSPPRRLSLDSLGLSKKTDAAVAKMFRDAITLHRGQVLTMINPLLATAGDDLYGQVIEESAFSPRHQVAPERQQDVLRIVLELGLQLVVSLPSRYPRPLDTKVHKSLALALSRLRVKLDAAVQDVRVQAVLSVYSGQPELWKLPGMMGRAAEILKSAALIKIRYSNRNPQVRFALYLARWVEACAGHPHYALLTDLLDAAFRSIRKTPPKWIDRLEIEMTRNLKHRAEWFKSHHP